MAVTNQNSAQIDNLAASPPVIENTHNMHGRLRVGYFSHSQDGVGDVLSTVAIFKLPPGKVRLLGSLSRIEHNWVTATIDMDVGWEAYVDLDGVAVIADDDGLDADVDVEVAGAIAIGSALGTADSKVFESRDGVVIAVKAQAAALADADSVEGFLVYVQD